MRFLFFLIVLLGQLNHSQNLFGQTINIPKDTSFSVNSTFEKEKKKFPNIQIAQVNSKHVKVSKDLTYKNVGNRDLKIDVFEPKLHHKKVGIVLLHGGGWRSGDKTHMHQLSLALAQKGYTCLAVEATPYHDVTNHNEYNKKHLSKSQAKTIRLSLQVYNLDWSLGMEARAGKVVP